MYIMHQTPPASWVTCHRLLIHGLHHELQQLRVAVHDLPHLKGGVLPKSSIVMGIDPFIC